MEKVKLIVDHQFDYQLLKGFYPNKQFEYLKMKQKILDAQNQALKS